MSSVKVYISSDTIEETEVTPVLKGAFTFKQKQGRLNYEHEMKDALRFDTKDDYQLLTESGLDECENINIRIEKLCGGSYQTYWNGAFSIFDSERHYDRCWIEVKPKPNDEYACFDEQSKEKVFTFSSGTVTTAYGIYGTYETYICVFKDFGVPESEFFELLTIPNDSCLPDSNWCLKDIELDAELAVEDPVPLYDITQRTIYHRITVAAPCGSGIPPIPGDWEILENDCAGSGNIIWWKCPGSSSIVVGDYTRGRTFENFITTIVDNMVCDLTIKSDFFNINPVGDAPSNEAYDYAAEYLHHMTVHQKSDIKNKIASNLSSSEAWGLKPEDFFNDLAKLFNVFFIIEDGTLILEHISFFSSVLGWDLSAENIIKKTSFEAQGKIKRHNFYYADPDCSIAFRAQPIINDCGDKDEDIRLSLISVDLAYIENPANNQRISDEGFVLISNVFYDNKHIIYNENDPLKWENLHENLHKHGRLYKSGQINGVQQDFLSWEPYIKVEKFKTDYCCDVEFNPGDLIRIDIDGQKDCKIMNAEHNIFTDKIELELAY